MALQQYLRDRQKQIDRALDGYLPRATVRPTTIHKAMRYSLFAGGKRLRPVLALAAAEACGASVETALPAACAVECIHTYSLIHDDLPAMDDDDLRRGRPTSHKVFGEGIAILAGDALLTIAFEILAQAKETTRYKMPALIRELATLPVASGSLPARSWIWRERERNSRASSFNSSTSQDGGVAHEFHPARRNERQCHLSAAGEPHGVGQALGLAFQVIDDILDVTQTTEKLGKTAGKDVAATKATYPAIFGLERSRAEAQRLTADAHQALAPLGSKAATLREIAAYLLARDY
jgi:geranylgeranyl diphosphate synthase type II